jgi:hypothetical protein
MSSRYWSTGIVSLPNSSKSAKYLAGYVSQTRKPGDVFFIADVTLVGGLSSSTFKVIYNTGGSTIQTGTLGSSDEVISSVSATNIPEVLKAYIKKYGKLDYVGFTTHSNTGSIIFIAQSVDTNITELNETTVSGYPITVNYTTNKITSSGSVSIKQLYDFSKYSNSLIANVNYNYYILSTSIGVNYILESPWEIELSNAITNGVNITGNVKLLSVFDLADHNISGKLTFTTAGTYNISNSTITELINNSGGNVIINATNSIFTTNTGPNITINNSVPINIKIVDINGNPIQGARVRIIKTSDSSVLLLGTTDSSGNISSTVNYISDISISGWARKSTGSPYYKESSISGTVTSSGFSSTVQMILDE